MKRSLYNSVFSLFIIAIISLSSCDKLAEVYPGEIEGFVYKAYYQGHFYYISEEPMSWKEGQAAVSKTMGYIVSITSVGENNLVLSILDSEENQPVYGWIGLTDEKDEGTFRWQSREQLKYTNWGQGEPNDEAYPGCHENDFYTVCSEDYVHMHSSWHTDPGTWNDAPEGMMYRVVLEVGW